jgi:hypothetical protein
MFGTDVNPDGRELRPSKEDKLKQQDQELYQAKSLIMKKHGRNQAALQASAEEIESIDDTRDFIQDQLNGQYNRE